MYGLPHDFDATQFVGRTVELVCFTANTVSIRFDGGCSITIEGSFAHGVGGEGSPSPLTRVPVRSSALMMLTGLNVVAARVESPGTLVLEFPDGQTLRCVDDHSDYESYRVFCNGREVIV